MYLVEYHISKYARKPPCLIRSRSIGAIQSIGFYFEREKEFRQHVVRTLFFQAEDGIRDAQESRGLGDVYKRQCDTQPNTHIINKNKL